MIPSFYPIFFLQEVISTRNSRFTKKKKKSGFYKLYFHLWLYSLSHAYFLKFLTSFRVSSDINDSINLMCWIHYDNVELTHVHFLISKFMVWEKEIFNADNPNFQKFIILMELNMKAVYFPRTLTQWKTGAFLFWKTFFKKKQLKTKITIQVFNISKIRTASFTLQASFWWESINCFLIGSIFHPSWICFLFVLFFKFKTGNDEKLLYFNGSHFTGKKEKKLKF